MARKKKVEEPQGSAFTVMFTSLSIILLAFFILLNSMATIDNKKAKQALGSLANTFTSLGKGPLFQKGNAVDPIGTEIGINAEGAGDALKKTVDATLRKQGVGDEVSLIQDGEDMLLVFPDRIVFDSGSAYLRPEMDMVLAVLADFIKSVDFPIVIEGHTDSNPIGTARFPSNWELSTARAGSVVRRLIEKHEIDPMRIRGEGRGQYQPVADNQTAKGRSENRRVVVRFVGMAAAAEGANTEPKPQLPEMGL